MQTRDSHKFCDGMQRRDVLRVGAAGFLGAGLMGLPDLLRLQAQGAEPGEASRPGSDVSLIFLFLKGGISTIDTWDMKPNAPSEFRGEFKPIDTNGPGIQICEHLPQVAGQMDFAPPIAKTVQDYRCLLSFGPAGKQQVDVAAFAQRGRGI